MSHKPETVNQSVTSTGITVVSEPLPHLRSVAVGIWVKSGSIHESERQSGVTHFIEHMLFKGSKKRSAYTIARTIEAAGGHLNAFTSNEFTCYYVRCLDSELPTAINVLSDMVISPKFPEKELEKEKKVVIEEMKMYRDTPDDLVMEEFSSKLFQHHPLGRPIIGSEQTVNAFTRNDLLEYMADRYKTGNLIVAAAGNVDHKKLVKQVEKVFSSYQNVGEASFNPVAIPDYVPFNQVISKKIEQTHVVLGRRSIHVTDENRYVILLLNSVLSGGMSSRLHQNVREKYGYCYSVFAFNQSFHEGGIFGVYVGTDAEYVNHVEKLIYQELKKLTQTQVSPRELEETKTQLKGKMLLAQENMSSRMNRIAKNELYYDRQISLDEMVAQIEAVSAEQILTFSQDFFNTNLFSKTVLQPED